MSDDSSNLLEQALWAIRGLPADFLMARVLAPDGEVLQPGQWVPAPREGSEVSHSDGYRQQWGRLPAVDLNWVDPVGATSVISLTSVEVVRNTVILDGPRCTARLWIPPWHGCNYGQIMWSQELAARPAGI